MKTLGIVLIIIAIALWLVYKSMLRNLVKSVRSHYRSTCKKVAYFSKEIIPADTIAQDRGVLRALKANLNSSSRSMLIVLKAGLEKDLQRLGRIKFKLEKSYETDFFKEPNKFREKYVWNDDDVKELISLESDIKELLANINKVI